VSRAPEIGEPAPDFDLIGTTPDGGRRRYELREERGHPVVLAFYPGDNTPTCTAQLCSYQDGLDRFTELDAVVWGISAQGLDSHERFANQRGLTFPLLSDPDKLVIRRYGVGWTLGTRRAVFVIDAEGTLRWRHLSTLGITYQDVDTIAGVLASLRVPS
jgi:thioredoxin-dependent peroxiredoxin